MKVPTLLFILLFFLSTNAAVRRVGFTDIPPVAGVDYTNFYLAHQAAANGDTIYVYPGKTISSTDWPTAYDRAEITKRLVIVGKGNWLDSSSSPRGNVNYQASKGRSYFGNSGSGYDRAIFFKSGSAGSTLTGFDGQGQTVVVECDDLTIKRNFNLNIFLPNNPINNLTVEQNYRIDVSGSNDLNVKYANSIIRNNFIYLFQLPVHSYNGTIANNTFAFDRSGAANGGDAAMSYVNTGFYNQSYIYLQGGSWLFENNLLAFYYTTTIPVFPFVITGTDMTTFNYNVATQSSNFSWPTGLGNNGNIMIAPAVVTSIFEAFPAIGNSSADGRYRLPTNSPAKAGSSVRPGSTVDAGMFGGPNPYKLSTIPSIPTIYSISSPQGNTPVGNTIQINVSTRSNN